MESIDPDSGPDMRAVEEEQRKLASMVDEVDMTNLGTALENLHVIGGLDISTAVTFGKPNTCVANLSLLEFPSLKLLKTFEITKEITAPYVPGFLHLRELAPALELLDKQRQLAPSLRPQVLLVDGCGVCHPRGAGLACAVGVRSGIATAGVSKNLLAVDGLTKDAVRQSLQQGSAGEADLRGVSGRVWGRALLTGNSVVNPVYVSVGHGLALGTACAIVRACCRFRVPEPIRLADLASRERIRRMFVPAAGKSAAGV